MRILWDMRLFSFAYGPRGVGTYTQSVAQDFLNKNSSHEIIIWGEKDKIPAKIINKCSIIIPYSQSNWKIDLLKIPYLIYKYKINIFHYWIALGPIYNIGVGLFHNCKNVITVYDLAIELWNEIPYTLERRKSWYWKIQKYLSRKSNAIITISEDTFNNYKKIISKKQITHKTIYPPLNFSENSDKNIIRNNNFVTLAGAPNKNLPAVINSFIEFSKEYKDYTLTIIGDTTSDNIPKNLPDSIIFKRYDFYKEELNTAKAFISLSTHEGLGLPIIEALNHSTPLLLSDIPSFHEIADNYAIYAKPNDIKMIIKNMKNLCNQNKFWVQKSIECRNQYKLISQNSSEKLNELYSDL